MISLLKLDHLREDAKAAGCREEMSIMTQKGEP